MSPYELISVNLTFGTLLVIYFTLFEMKNQRESLYKPDLILSNSKSYYMYSEKSGNNYFPSLWVNEKIDLNNKQLRNNLINDPEVNRIGIPIFNIGMGTAKNIKIKWEFNKNLFNEIKSTKYNPIWPKGANIRFQGSIKRKIDSTDNLIDYILPAQIVNSLENIYLPLDFQYEVISSLPIIIREILRVPQLNVTLSFKDMANQEYKKRYILKFMPELRVANIGENVKYMEAMKMKIILFESDKLFELDKKQLFDGFSDYYPNFRK